MAKVKAEYSKTFIQNGEEVRIIIQWDVSDNEEGYGVVIGDETTDETIAFGQGPLAYLLSGKLFDAVVNEIESSEDTLKLKYDYESLNSLYDWIRQEVLIDTETSNDLQKILNYINKWYKE